ncbi:translational elongation factor EF-1 alpha, partial [Teratosphaeriaceae sp. CCFEE 6253]
MAESPAQVRKENKQSTQVLEQLMKKLSVSKPGDDAKGTSQEIASFINGDIEEHEAPTKV